MSRAHPNHFKRRAEIKILHTVRQTASTYAMFEAGDSILVAVSGGSDSIALLHILQTLAPEFSFQMAIAHLNHSLRRSESERDAAFVLSLGHKLKLPCFIEKRDVHRYRHRHKLSLEDAARRVRYEFLEHIADTKGFSKIALGHHFDDNAELVLMYLLRGSGPLGLSGIAPVRGGKIVRPLINVKRSEILDFIAEKKLDFVSDTSNLDPVHLRNKLRHQLLPLLTSSYNPKISETLNRLASITRTDEQWIDGLIKSAYRRTRMTKAPGQIILSREKFAHLAVAARRRVIRKAILELKGNLWKIGLSHVDAAVQLAMDGPLFGFIDLPDRIRIHRDRQMLIITREKNNLRLAGAPDLKSKFPDYEYEISKPGKLHIKEAGCHLELTGMGIEEIPDLRCTGQKVAFFDIDMLAFPLTVRNFRPGDRFSSLGMAGSQKLQKFFSNNKFSRAERMRCPLLVSQDQIIWVAGHRPGDSAKIKPETRRVLKAQLLLA